MKTPVMPQNLQSMLKNAFREGDVEGIVYFNKIWNAHVKEVREEYEKELKQSEGRYQYEE